MEDDPINEGHRIFIPNSSIWFLELFVLFTFNIALQGLYNIHQVLHNPFGPRHIDIPHEIISGGIRKLAENMMLVESRMPPKMTCVKMGLNANPAIRAASSLNDDSSEASGSPGTKRAPAKSVPKKLSTAASKKPSTTTKAQPPIVPEPWNAKLDEASGRYYYHNSVTGETTWTLPAEATPAGATPPPSPPWSEWSLPPPPPPPPM